MNDNFLTYLIICFALSFFIGIERQYRRRMIGLRTSILVSIGSFLFVTFTFSVGAIDVSRIASQVVAGISFLGAGVILKDGTKIKGLTTAATLWCDAAIGVLCAGGAIREAICGTIIILFSNIVLRYVNQIINVISDNKYSKQTYKLIIKTKKENIVEIKKNVFNQLKYINAEYNYILQNQASNSTLIYTFTVLKKEHDTLEKMINKIDYEYELQSISLEKKEELKVEELEEEL